MEWNRAKTILIISFLLLNILLGYQLWVSKLEMKKSNPDNEQITREIKLIMNEKGIALRADLPEDVPKLREITVQFDSDIQTGVVQFKHPLEIKTLFMDNLQMKELIGQQIPHAEEYELDPAMGTQDYYLMHQIYNGHPLFDVNLKLYKQAANLIARYDQSYVDVQSGKDQNEQKVLSAISAIGSLVENNHLQRGNVITDVRLGYHGQIYNSETQVLAPAWRIVTSDGDMIYVHAITGGVMSHQKEKAS